MNDSGEVKETCNLCDSINRCSSGWKVNPFILGKDSVNASEYDMVKDYVVQFNKAIGRIMNYDVDRHNVTGEKMERCRMFYENMRNSYMDALVFFENYGKFRNKQFGCQDLNLTYRE